MDIHYTGCISNRDEFDKIHATVELFPMAMRWRQKAPTYMLLRTITGRLFVGLFGISPLASRLEKVLI